jgi:hypothetical protein
MEWVAEGLKLVFIGLLVLATTIIIGSGLSTANLVFCAAYCDGNLDHFPDNEASEESWSSISIIYSIL